MKDLEVTIGFLLAIEQGETDRLCSILSETMVFTGPVPRPMTRAAFISLVTAMRTGIPNWRSHFRNVQVNGSFVSMTIEATGTHLRRLPPLLPGMPSFTPTGERFHLPPQQIEFFLAGDKIQRIHLEPVKDGWINGMLKQLGIIIPASN